MPDSPAARFARVEAAFKRDGFSVKRHTVKDGRLGVLAEHQAARNTVTAEPKRALYLEGDNYRMGWLLGLLAERDVSRMATDYLDNVAFAFFDNSAASRGGIFAPLKELIVRIISEAVERTLADIPGEYLGGVTQMNILVISGSRNPQGQTARAMEAFIKGLEAGGGACETVFLPPLTIERCRQCEDNGWGLCRKEGRCIIEDDFSMLLEKLRKADAAVFATPVYFHDLSESLKVFLDRLRRVMRNDAAKPGVAAKPAAGICVAGGGGGGSPLCSFLLERTLATCGFDVLDMVPVRRQNLAMKLPILEAAGKNLTAYRPSAG